MDTGDQPGEGHTETECGAAELDESMTYGVNLMPDAATFSYCIVRNLRYVLAGGKSRTYKKYEDKTNISCSLCPKLP